LLFYFIVFCFTFQTTKCLRKLILPNQIKSNQIKSIMAKSMSMNQATGLQGMLKSGHAAYQGIHGAILKNIEAVSALSAMVKTSLGPYGMNKLVVNHLEKIFVTSDCATILRELEIQHPAARMLVLAVQMQESEYGDNTNYVASICGELLRLAQDLIMQGLHTTEIISGYQRAYEKVLELLPTLVVRTVKNPRDVTEMCTAIKAVISTKQVGYENFLSEIVAKACLMAIPSSDKKPKLNMDSVRIAKLRGGSVDQSSLLQGMVLIRDAEGKVKSAKNAKVIVFGCGFEATSAEAKGTILIKNAEELMSYNKSEEKMMEQMVGTVAATGVNVVICNGTISDMALHFFDKHDIMVIKVSSKFETKRLCLTLGATAVIKLGAASPEEMGFCSSIEIKEIAGRKLIVFSQELAEDTGVSTIIIRASTENVLNDLERSIDDGVHACKAIFEDGRLLAGAGAVEMELSRLLKEYAAATPGIDQYGIAKFGEAFEAIPRTLAENSGTDSTNAVYALHVAHNPLHTHAFHNDGDCSAGRAEVIPIADRPNMGFDIDELKPINASEKGIYDIYITKVNALRLAVDAALTILKIDQIIMSKPAGGPKPREAGPMDM
jgi:T-complex protein 1 subunit theta